MAQRQGRRSLGLAPLPGGGQEVEMSEAQRFEDYRRRHSKQNKDIIMDNIARKAAVKSLQDDIATLHTELLEVRQANIVLQAQVKRMQREAGRMHGQSARDALDHILSAVPALRQLRDSLSTISPTNQIHPGKNMFAFLNPVDNTYATRPAAVGAQAQGLRALLEASESGSEFGVELDVRRAVGKVRGRHTGVGSVAASRSPRPAPIARSSPRISSTPSPRRSASPSPRKQHTTVTGKTQRRRRESGLLLRPPPSPSSIAAVPIVQSEVVDIPPYEADIESDWEEGKGVVLKPDEAMSLVQEPETVDVIENDSPVPAVTADVFMPPEEIDRVTVSAPVKVMSTVAEESEGGSGSSRNPSSKSSGSVETPAGHETARGRRARGSVNYKEPSLNKKMRKPDGVTVEEALKPISSKSTASTSRPGSPQSSASPPPAVPALPTQHVRNTASDALTTTLSIVKSSRQAHSQANIGGTRRKSTLPTRGITARANYMDVGSDDEEDVDELVGYLEEHADMRQRIPSASATVEAQSSKSTTASTKMNGAATHTASIAKITPRPDSTSARAGLDSGDKPRSSASTNTASANSAPRKPATGLGIGRPVMTSSTSRVPSNGSRSFTPIPSSSAPGRMTHHRMLPKKTGKVQEKESARDVLADRDLPNEPCSPNAGLGGDGSTGAGMRASSVGKLGNMSATGRRRISSAV